MEIAYVRWVDSADTSGWIRISELADVAGCMECTTVGFVVTETDDYIVLSSTSNNEDGASAAVMSPLSIPKVAVTEIVVEEFYFREG